MFYETSLVCKMKMKDLNPKDHHEYFEKFDDSAWKKLMII